LSNLFDFSENLIIYGRSHTFEPFQNPLQYMALASLLAGDNASLLAGDNTSLLAGDNAT